MTITKGVRNVKIVLSLCAQQVSQTLTTDVMALHALVKDIFTNIQVIDTGNHTSTIRKRVSTLEATLQKTSAEEV